MFSQVVRYSPWALPWVTNQDTKKWLSRDCWDEGGLEVHVLLSFLTNEHIQTFHVCSEGRVSLPFLPPNQPSSGYNNSGPWYNAFTVEQEPVI